MHCHFHTTLPVSIFIVEDAIRFVLTTLKVYVMSRLRTFDF